MTGGDLEGPRRRRTPDVHAGDVAERLPPDAPGVIWNQIRYNVTPEVNVISVVFLAVAIGMVLIAVSLTRMDLLARRSVEGFGF